MAVWLVGLILLFFLYALCVVATLKIENRKSKLEIRNSPERATAHMRRRDLEKIIRALNAEGRTEIPGPEAA